MRAFGCDATSSILLRYLQNGSRENENAFDSAVADWDPDSDHHPVVAFRRAVAARQASGGRLTRCGHRAAMKGGGAENSAPPPLPLPAHAAAHAAAHERRQTC